MFLCSAQSGRWLLRMRDHSDKATTRRSGSWMGLATSAASLPRGGPALSRRCFVSRLPGSRFPPKPLDSSPRWVATCTHLGSTAGGSECCPWGQIVKMGGCRHRRHGRGGTARQKALVLLCSRLAAANTSTSRSVVLSSIFETQLHVFRSRIPQHPHRALPHYGTPSTGTLCSVAWPTVDLPRSVLGSSAQSWCRARSLRSLCNYISHRPSGRGTPERDAGRNLNAMSPLFKFHGPLGAPFPSCCSALWSVRAGVDAVYHLIEPPPPGPGTWSRPPAGSSSRGCYMLAALRESAVSGLHPRWSCS